ncbi:hypothetical protein E1262_11790 [Jiangella aurantiaca]|uniref:Uncharacterized protein n=1 Tax=Jiangella aurantiaca TaxID=2530373 RepID=A0A4R5ABR3_9ACTN|nr:hypothetical protein [Jiangella aurantiaca]TDD69631.1 hypothetical protein E1262_11790 [Jiangella aurantiaca]
MTNAHLNLAAPTIDNQDVRERRIPRQRTRTGFDDEIARLIRDRVQVDLAKRTARRRRHRDDREALERRRRHAKQALHAEKPAAKAQQTCRCPQPRPPALLERDPADGTNVLTLCPVCGRRT